MLVWLLACGGGTDPVVGCWESVDKPRVECFWADGRYELKSEKAGQHAGRWSREAGYLVVTVDPFPADRYATAHDGESLVLSRADRPDRRYRPFQLR